MNRSSQNSRFVLADEGVERVAELNPHLQPFNLVGGEEFKTRGVWQGELEEGRIRIFEVPLDQFPNPVNKPKLGNKAWIGVDEQVFKGPC